MVKPHRRRKATAVGPISFEPLTEDGALRLIGLQRLSEIPAPEDDLGTMGRWFQELRQGGLSLRLYVDGAGDRWLLLRDESGLLQYAFVEPTLRLMQRQAKDGVRFGETSALDRFQAWLQAQIER